MITPDEDGRLPLHNALRALDSGVALGTIKLLVQADDSTVRIRDSDGSLPLHIACWHIGHSNVVQYFLELDRASLLASDDYGNTPLHIACRRANYDAIALFLTQYPDSPVATRNEDGNLPIQLLLANQHDHFPQENVGYVSCIFLLLRANPMSIVLALAS